MKFDRESMLLYAVTDRTWLNGRTLPELVEQAILGGTTFVQLREKNVTDTEFLSIAEQVKKVTDQYHVPFIINDNIEVALKADADGVHVGQKDMEAGNVRELIGKDKILGVSAQTVEQALAAERSGRIFNRNKTGRTECRYFGIKGNMQSSFYSGCRHRRNQRI